MSLVTDLVKAALGVAGYVVGWSLGYLGSRAVAGADWVLGMPKTRGLQTRGLQTRELQ